MSQIRVYDVNSKISEKSDYISNHVVWEKRESNLLKPQSSFQENVIGKDWTVSGEGSDTNMDLIFEKNFKKRVSPNMSVCRNK